MNLCPNPTGIPDGKLWGLLSMLNTDGGLAFTPQTCKETTLYFVGQDAILDFNVYVHVTPAVCGRIDKNNPALVFWMLDRQVASRSEIIDRIESAISMLCSKMGLRAPVVQAIEDTKNAIAVFFPPYFMMTSPATMHGFMTFVRGAARNKHPTSSIYKFIDSMVWHSLNNDGCADATHIRASQNLYDFLNKTMDCNIRNYCDWLLKRGPSNASHYTWHGLVNYNMVDIEKTNPKRDVFTIQELATKNGTFDSRIKRILPGERYSNWSNSYLVRPVPPVIIPVTPQVAAAAQVNVANVAIADTW